MSILVRSNYATKANLKGATGIDTSMLALKTDLASLKTKVDADLSKLSNVVDNDVEKKLYNKSVTKGIAFDKIPNISGLVTKTRQGLEKKIGDVDKPYWILMSWTLMGWSWILITTQKSQILKTRYYVTGLVTTASLNKKATKIENIIPDDVTNLAKRAAVNKKLQKLKVKYLTWH